MSGVFEGKVALIVGGGRGIGRAVALGLSREGAKVAIADSGCATDGTGHDATVAQAVADEVRMAGGEAMAIAVDASSPDASRHMMDAVRQSYGRIDAGFYSAGISREKPLVRLSDADFEAVLDVHVRGALRFTRELATVMVEQRQGGAILLTTSGSGLFGTSHQTALSMAAGAVIALTKTAATELRRHGIRVNAIAPTARTRLTEDLPLFQSIRSDSLSPEHVVPLACHLLSEASSDVHGEVLGVAGGRMYAFRTNETSGLFQEGPPVSLAALAAGFREVTRT